MSVVYEWLVGNWYVALVAAFLLFLTLVFFSNFFLRAIAIGRELDRVIRSLERIKADKVTDPLEIISKAMGSSALAHLWSEYTETLHPQREVGIDGQSLIVRWRATALADMFFSEQAIVDTRLKTEFFKHLPGIMTGLGIIGTFLGLIVGLQKFEVYSDSLKVRRSACH